MKKNLQKYVTPAFSVHTQQVETSFCTSMNGTHEGFTETDLTEDDGYGWS